MIDIGKVSAQGALAYYISLLKFWPGSGSITHDTVIPKFCFLRSLLIFVINPVAKALRSIISSSIRRAHTKSRKGCQSCKNRKVRRDEYFPQCRNCTKRGLRCAYMDDPAASQGLSPSQNSLEFAWRPEVEEGAHEWQLSNVFPFPQMRIDRTPELDTLSSEECRLLYHAGVISRNLELTDSTKFATWAHKIPEFVPPI